MKLILFFFLLTVSNFSIAQVDFDNYKSITAVGVMPEDFSKKTPVKIQVSRSTRKTREIKKKEDEFNALIKNGIEDILHSGKCIYGDPISEYTKDVARNLLKNDLGLFQKLRFYTIKSTNPNAFTTDEGSIIISTGLIARLSNEAQLAFILAHEISHFAEKDTIATFDFNPNQTINDFYVASMSNYSIADEFKADQLAVALCHRAGYSDNEIYSSLDAMMDCYLPFDELEFSKSYFNTNQFYIPENQFPKNNYPIRLEPVINDANSAHKNIGIRKENIAKELSALDNWQKVKFIVDQEKFSETVRMARFENIRTNVLDGAYPDALYSIYLMEQEFPQSTFLHKMKAHAWLGLYQYRSDLNASNTISKTMDFECESSMLHSFINKLTHSELRTLAIREIYNVKNQYPKSLELKAICDRLINGLADDTSFVIAHYSTKTFQQLSQEKLNNDASNFNGTDAEKTNYQRIRSNININSANDFDSSLYYLYGLGDVLSDSEFVSTYSTYKSEHDKKEADLAHLNSLKKSERKKKLKEQKKEFEEELRLSLKNKLLIVNPTIISSNKKGISYEKADKNGKILQEAIMYTKKYTGMEMQAINRNMLDSGSTTIFNELNTLHSFKSQIFVRQNMKSGVVPVDYDEIQSIKSLYNTPGFMFSSVIHSYKPKLSVGGVIGCAIGLPSLPIYLTRAYGLANTTELNNLIINSDKGTVQLSSNVLTKSPINKRFLGNQIFDILNDFGLMAN